jgi:hypothetical protein
VIAPTLTDDVRAAVALAHLDKRDRASGNADAYALDSRDGYRRFDGARYLVSGDWSRWWRAKANEHETEARAILPPADGWEPCAPAYVGGMGT